MSQIITGHVVRMISRDKQYAINHLELNPDQTIKNQTVVTVHCEQWFPMRPRDIVRLSTENLGGADFRVRHTPENYVFLDDSESSTVKAMAELGQVAERKAIEFYGELQSYLLSLQKYTKEVCQTVATDPKWHEKLTAVESREWHFPLWKVHDMLSFHSMLHRQARLGGEVVLAMGQKYFGSRFAIILKKWYYERITRQFYLWGLRKTVIGDIDDHGVEILFRLRTNPYFYPQIGIDLADNLMHMQNLTLHSRFRQCGIIIRKMYHYLQNTKWTYVPLWLMSKWYGDITEYHDCLKKYFFVRIEELTVQGKPETVYMLNQPYQVEQHLARTFAGLAKCTVSKIDPSYTIGLSEDQQKAVVMALNSALSIITGSAGTGKTTIIAQIMHNLKLQGRPFMATSFTGKAVSRIREVIKNKEPRTLHSLMSGSPGGWNHLIIDESSMVSSLLLSRFLKKFPPLTETGHLRYSITLIGDVNQLEPIEWGLMFNESLKTKVPNIRLTKVFRTNVSSIVLNANKLIERDDGHYMTPTDIEDTMEDIPEDFDGDPSEEPTGTISEFPFILDRNFKLIAGDKSNIYEFIKTFYDLKCPLMQITCITPFSKAKNYVDDVKDINQMFTSIYIPRDQPYLIDTMKIRWSVGERVMNVQNILGASLFNGDEGLITKVTSDGLEVTINDRPYIYHNRYETRVGAEKYSIRADDLTLDLLMKSSCMSCHKAQGSEYDVVIVYVPKYEGSFITRNWLYTAFTRAVKYCIVVGHLDTVNRNTTNIPKPRRETLALRMA